MIFYQLHDEMIVFWIYWKILKSITFYVDNGKFKITYMTCIIIGQCCPNALASWILPLMSIYWFVGL